MNVGTSALIRMALPRNVSRSTVDRETLRGNAMRISALVPTFITALYRLHKGLEPVMPHPELAYAANYLYMLTGQEPDPEHARAVEHYMISTIDHGFNA